MTKLQAVRWFANTVAQQKVVIARNRITNNWMMSTNELRMTIPTNLTYEPDETDILFRNDFIKRYAPAKELLDVTITILHEIGHYFTRFDYDLTEDYILRLHAANMSEYLRIPCERLATDWAIAWLHDLEHLAIAKQFEADFMGK